MPSRHYNPEKRAWRGRSYKKGGEHIRTLRENPREVSMTIEERMHECENCGNRQKIKTNHEGGCLDYCKECSWKGQNFGKGLGQRMFGVIHRPFKFVGTPAKEP